MKDRGILYLAIGDEHYQYAKLSLQTVRQHMPDTEVAIVTNIKDSGDPFDFTRMVECDSYDPLVKIMAVSGSPFDYTLFLDADTYLCTPVYQVFDILDHFDVAAVMQANRINWPTARPVPRIFPEVNSGFLAYRNSKAGAALMAEWIESYHQAPDSVKGDMGALREALFYSNARLCILPPEFNLHITELTNLGPDAVRVLHGGDSNAAKYESIRRRVNASGVPRLYIPEKTNA